MPAIRHCQEAACIRRKSVRRLDAVVALVASAFAVPLVELCAEGRRSAAAALARHSAMYLAHVVFGASFTRIGGSFGRDRTTVAYACRRIEDLRDDPDLDGLLTRLEAALAAHAEDEQ